MPLATRYLGLYLRSPFIVGSSPLCDDPGMARQLQDAGAGAVVMRSLFMEQFGTGPALDGPNGVADYHHTPERYLRHLVLQLARQAGSSPADWDTLATVTLPEGVYVMPSSLTQSGGLVANPADWKRVTDPAADLVSDLFTSQSLSVLLEGDASAQLWTGVGFTPNGTLAALGGGQPPKGALVIALGVRRPPGSYQPGESPVQLGSPHAVRGLILSAYGVPALLGERSSF